MCCVFQGVGLVDIDSVFVCCVFQGRGPAGHRLVHSGRQPV